MTPTGSGNNLSVIGGASNVSDDDPNARPPVTTGEIIDERAPYDPNDPLEEEGVYLSANDILNIDDVVTKIVTVPEWSKGGKPGKVILKSLDGEHRDRWYNSVQYTDGKGRNRIDMKGANARLVAMSAVRPDGEPLFRLSQVEALQTKNAAVIERLAGYVRKMSGITDTDDEEEEKRRREGLE